MRRFYQRRNIEPASCEETQRCDWLRWAAAACSVAWIVACAGCYDAESLAEERRDIANGLKLVEIDIGTFRVTLPAMPGSDGAGVVGFQAFGQVANRDMPFVTKQLEERQPELRHRMLLAIRKLRQGGVDEPDLTSLRQQVSQVLNNMLGEGLIQHVGIQKFTYVAM